MSDTYVLAIEGLSDLKSLDGLDEAITQAAFRAINKTTERGYAEIGRRIRREVRFPANYLTGTDGRMRISKRASANSLEAAISARRRPTSLARFVTSSLHVGGGKRAEGVRVEVKPGSAIRLQRAFLVKLRAGASTDTQSNLGVAVRLKPGAALRKSSAAKRLSNNLYLLYGPSVQQAFLANSGKGSASDAAPEMAVFLEQEFLRLKALDL
jgi:hypothetical protein